MLTSTQVLSGLQNLGAQVKETTDTRTLLQRFRKSGLYRLLRANGFDVDENMEPEKMLNYAMAFEDKLDFSKIEMTPDGFGGFNVKKPMSHVMEERAFDAKVQDVKKDLKDMDRFELMRLAKEKGLPVATSMTKEDLVQAISLKAVDEQDPT